MSRVKSQIRQAIFNCFHFGNSSNPVHGKRKSTYNLAGALLMEVSGVEPLLEISKPIPESHHPLLCHPPVVWLDAARDAIPDEAYRRAFRRGRSRASLPSHLRYRVFAQWRRHLHLEVHFRALKPNNVYALSCHYQLWRVQFTRQSLARWQLAVTPKNATNSHFAFQARHSASCVLSSVLLAII